MRIPKKVGPLKYVVPMEHHKTVGVQTFQNPHTNKEYDYRLVISDIEWNALIFPLTANNEVIVLHQYRHAKDCFLYEIPGGCPDSSDEEPALTARRELTEETGFVAEHIIPLLPKAAWLEPVSIIKGNFYYFLATGCEKKLPTNHDEIEYIEVLSIPFQKWMHMVLDGTVQDNKTITATLLAERYLTTPHTDLIK